MSEVSLGIDIGGTKIAAGLVTRDGKLLEHQTFPTPSESSESILLVLKQIVSQFTDVEHTVVGIGIGSAGQVLHEKGQILSATDNLKDWNNIHIVDELKKVTDLPIWLDNDANAFAVAEYIFGEARGTKDLIGLTLGTGVGGGVVSGGKLLHGQWGAAGELGHITVNMHGPTCNCGSKGCLEVYASGTGIANRMKDRSNKEMSSKEVFALYEAGNGLAMEVIDEAIEALTYGMISLIHTFNPTVIVLGGGLLQRQKWLAEKVRKSVPQKGMDSLVKPVKIMVSNLGEHAGVIGAASLAWYTN
ncbi:ROK family protein [Ornithinibacillus halotolerans]|uniref:Glucokinase n=1 Tax=Ornithinibacillus halotolerans TaxID=1274357 RepID=A0A916S0V7_9BACI|nr:ROK family protein [Ornithinibacillus halotolerans]GGA79520.1 glucokinase [Ornithinibacillus halotolerans]